MYVDASRSQAQVMIVLAGLIFVLLLAAVLLDRTPKEDEEAEPPGPVGEVRLV